MCRRVWACLPSKLPVSRNTGGASRLPERSTTVAVTSVRTPQSHPSTRWICALGALGDGNLDDAIEHGVARAIRFGDLTQGGGEDRPLLQTCYDRIGQRQSQLWLGPGCRPAPRLIWGAKRKEAVSSLQINAEPMDLALLASVISHVGQDAHFEHGNRLHFFVGGGKTAVFEVKIACLFDQALQFDRAPSIGGLFAQGGQGGFDRFAVFARGFILRFRQEHALLKQRQNAGKLLLALCLTPEDTTRLLGFTAPLPVSMRVA